jgi:hypothetical protein
LSTDEASVVPNDLAAHQSERRAEPEKNWRDMALNSIVSSSHDNGVLNMKLIMREG